MILWYGNHSFDLMVVNHSTALLKEGTMKNKQNNKKRPTAEQRARRRQRILDRLAPPTPTLPEKLTLLVLVLTTLAIAAGVYSSVHDAILRPSTGTNLSPPHHSQPHNP